MSIQLLVDEKWIYIIYVLVVIYFRKMNVLVAYKKHNVIKKKIKKISVRWLCCWPLINSFLIAFDLIISTFSLNYTFFVLFSKLRASYLQYKSKIV